MICKYCGADEYRGRGVVDGEHFACLDCIDNMTESADYLRLITENSRFRQEIAHARKELWMLDEEDETFLQGVEGVHFRIIGLLNEVKNLEYRLRQLERPTPPTPAATERPDSGADA